MGGQIYMLASEICREEGEDRLARLVVQLLHDGRNDDILKVTDKECRERLYQEYEDSGESGKIDDICSTILYI